MLRYDDAALEFTHDYIQWLFPLHHRSGANPDAPVLDDDAVTAFHTRPGLRTALRRSFERMMAFYTSSGQWLTPGNHNHLRLTRMLISLRTLGLHDEADSLYRFIVEAAATRGGVSETTLRYWREAMASSSTRERNPPTS